MNGNGRGSTKQVTSVRLSLPANFFVYHQVAECSAAFPL